jgi:hypothetical protein
MKQIRKTRIRTFQTPRKVFRLLENKQARAADQNERQVVGGKSEILAEGSKQITRSSFFKRILYSTWNAIPIGYTFPIARELLKTLTKVVFSKLRRRSIEETLDLAPNYPEVKMAPLEMSFTRRPRGVLNWFKDIFSGKPYRLLSDMKDGVLYSPKGGSLSGIFPRTMSKMTDDPITQSILKLNRLMYLESLEEEYQELQNLDSVGLNQLMARLLNAGKKNTLMLYMFGFRDSQIEILEDRIESVLDGSVSSQKLMAVIREKKHELTRHSGFLGDSASEMRTGLLEEDYELRDFDGILENNDISLSGSVKEKVEKLFSLREELVEEAGKTVGPIEYCRASMYRIAREIGEKVVSANALQNSSDIYFLTIYEVSDLMKKGVIDHQTIERRRNKVNEIVSGN